MQQEVGMAPGDGDGAAADPAGEPQKRRSSHLESTLETYWRKEAAEARTAGAAGDEELGATCRKEGTLLRVQEELQRLQELNSHEKAEKVQDILGAGATQRRRAILQLERRNHGWKEQERERVLHVAQLGAPCGSSCCGRRSMGRCRRACREAPAPGGHPRRPPACQGGRAEAATARARAGAAAVLQVQRRQLAMTNLKGPGAAGPPESRRWRGLDFLSGAYRLAARAWGWKKRKEEECARHLRRPEAVERAQPGEAGCSVNRQLQDLCSSLPKLSEEEAESHEISGNQVHSLDNTLYLVEKRWKKRKSSCAVPGQRQPAAEAAGPQVPQPAPSQTQKEVQAEGGRS